MDSHPTFSGWKPSTSLLGLIAFIISLELIWDGTTNATAVLLSGHGFWDLRADGNEITNNSTTPTGDVLLSTKNFANGDNYTIIAEFR